MAKRVIKITKGGAPAGGSEGELGIKPPVRPVRLGEEINPADFSRTQPMKRIVVAGSSPRRQMRTASPSTADTEKKPQPKRVKSGPPMWLIPVGIIGLVILVVIIASVSSNSQQDPYFASGPVVQAAPSRIPKNGPQPMKQWMDQHGETDMAKTRKTRMQGRGTTTVTKKSQ